MKKLFVFLSMIFISSSAIASELSATQLHSKCNEIQKGLTGQQFNAESVQTCQAYIAGFFDSMVIIEGLNKKKYFCIPPSLPKDQSNILLGAWIEKNKEIADKTTATVALFSAFKKAFECK